MTRQKGFPYRLNQMVQRTAMRLMGWFTPNSSERQFDLEKERIEKIILVRATFRMGHSILAMPAILLFRKRFPRARIDFVGSPLSRDLFKNLPVERYFGITRRIPDSLWAYVALFKTIRSVRYDLAVDVSCSQSAMGSFIVGFSGARFRAGLRGKWDRWFNVRIARPREKNKYRILPAFLACMGLESHEMPPLLMLSPGEKEEGRKRIETLIGQGRGPIVSVFVGGRDAWGKRWPGENFCLLITALYRRGINVVTFFGPEENKLIGFCRHGLEIDVPLVSEPSPRTFAAMISNCHLFISCDTGPMHLACAVGVPTVAIFQKPDFDHWGPPANLGRIVYQAGGPSVTKVLEVSLAELSRSLTFSRQRSSMGYPEAIKDNPPSVWYTRDG